MWHAVKSIALVLALQLPGTREIELHELLGKEFRGLRLGEPISWSRGGLGYAYDDVDGYHLVILIPKDGRLDSVLAWPDRERARQIEDRLKTLGPGVTEPGRDGLILTRYLDGMIVVSRFRSGEINAISISRRE